MIDAKTLAILRCPESHRPLRLATAAEVAVLNQQMSAGSAKNRAGKAVSEPVTGALIRDDGKIAYPIRNDIPILLIEEGLELSSKT